MRVQCSECGCWVDRGMVVEPCGRTDCCCRDLPVRTEPEHADPQFGQSGADEQSGYR